MSLTEVDLRNASINGDLELVKKCLAAGVNINSTTKAAQLNTPLHNACTRGHFDTVKLLLENGANLEATNFDGETPIVLAIQHRYAKLTEFLIDQGADIETTDNSENNLLHKAAMVDHPHMAPVIKVLISKGVNLNAKNQSGKRPIDYSRHIEVRNALAG